MYLWPSIEGLRIVLRNAKSHLDQNSLPKVVYRGKPKLDGTNASVVIKNDKHVTFQSRNVVITPQADNMGFARWAETVSWASVRNESTFSVMVIHGEWAGSGIQKGCAVQSIGQRGFFVFAIEYASDIQNPETGDWSTRILVTEPEEIARLLEPISDRIRVLPWYGQEIEIDFANPASEVLKYIETTVLEVESCDPYIKDVFDVEGIGEGLVFYPVRSDRHNLGAFDAKRSEWERLAFKAKGEKHRVRVAKTAVQTDVEAVGSISEFVTMFVTEARCQQGLTAACQGVADIQQIGDFLKWISSDVKKESPADLEVSGLTWKQVSGEVAKAAKVWFMSEVQKTV